MRFILIAGITALMSLASMWTSAASFDCAKARSPLEKFICANPDLDTEDARMGEVFKRLNKSFPLPGFILATQKVFVSGYAYCLQAAGKSAPAAATLNQCLQTVRSRISELETYQSAKVYSNAKAKFTPEDLAVLVYMANGKERITLWGNWMPNGNQPKPFPDGSLCALDDQLKPVKGGFKTESTDDSVIKITDAVLNISEFVSCTPRNGIAEGDYKRFK